MEMDKRATTFQCVRGINSLKGIFAEEGERNTRKTGTV